MIRTYFEEKVKSNGIDKSLGSSKVVYFSVSGCFFSLFLSFFRENTFTTIKWPFYLFVMLAFTPKTSKNGKDFFLACKSQISVLLVAKRSAVVFFVDF